MHTDKSIASNSINNNGGTKNIRRNIFASNKYHTDTTNHIMCFYHNSITYEVTYKNKEKKNFSNIPQNNIFHNRYISMPPSYIRYQH